MTRTLSGSLLLCLTLRGAVASPSAAPPPMRAEDARRAPLIAEDVGYGMRLTTMYNVLNISPHNGETAFLGTTNGYLFRTEDGGRTWDESTILVEQREMFQSSGQVLYQGRVRESEFTEIPCAGWDCGMMGGFPHGANAWPTMGEIHPLALDFGFGGNGPPGPPAPAQGGLSGELAGAPMPLATGGAGAGSGNELGLGLSQRAPRLSLLISRRGRPIPSINLKRLITLRGSRPAVILRTTWHPTDKNVIFASTSFGLFRSRDGGRSWVRVFLGTKAEENVIEELTFDPKDSRRCIMATDAGIFESRDGGENFRKSTTYPGGLTHHVLFTGNYVFAASNGALWRSPDGGRSWELPWITTFPTASQVWWVEQDPFDPNVGYIATADGAFKSEDFRKGGNASWVRLGGLRFVAEVMKQKIVACRHHRGHLYVSTREEFPNQAGWDPPPHANTLWESWDGGENWKPIYTGRTYGKIEWFEVDPENNDELWVLWTRGVERLRRGVRTPQQRIGEIDASIPQILGDVPSLSQVVAQALITSGLELATLAEKRRHATWRAFIPRFSFMYQQHLWGSSESTVDIQFPQGPRYVDQYDPSRGRWVAWLSWDLASLVYNDELMPMSQLRVAALHNAVRWRVAETTIRSYSEMLRLKLRDAAVPPKSLKARISSALRDEELQALLGFYMQAPVKGMAWKGDAR